MKFHFSRYGLAPKEKKLQRLFEIIPGLMSWTTLIGMVVISMTHPIIAAVIIIAFIFYWVLRIFYMTIFLIISYFRLSVEEKTDWMSRVHGLDRLESYAHEFIRKAIPKEKGRRISHWFHSQEIKPLLKNRLPMPASKNIYHLVIIPVVRETREIIEPGIRSLADQAFPTKQMIVLLAVEERSNTEVKKSAEAVKSKFKNTFYHFDIHYHPDGLPGEARVKGANVTFAAKKAAEFLNDNKISFENVIVSCFDVDTIVTHNYFSCLTYHFMIAPDRNQCSFQPIPVFNNNIWEAPGLTRVLELGSSFFQLIEATNAEELVTFSSHSMSFKALHEVGYWPVDMISDDSAIFWKAFVHYDGRYRVIPLNVTVSMDAVCSDNWLKSVVNVYQQKRRWAWGVENFPIVMRAFLRSREISPRLKALHTFKILETHFSWATWGFMLTVIGWLPAIFAGREFSSSVLYYNAPRITGIIINLSSIALIISILLSFSLLPKQKIKFPLIRRIILALEWLFVPFVILFLNTIPALDAQTRLMLGKKMEFWVTDKKR